jgi:hypothetical protein
MRTASLSEPSKQATARLWAAFLLGMALMLPMYLQFATERFDTAARLLGFIGLGLSLLPAMLMLTGKKDGSYARPCSVAAVGLTVALFYHLAVFHERTLLLRWGEARLSPASVTMGQLLSALATPALWAGWALAGMMQIRRVLPQPRLYVPAAPLRRAGAFIVVLSLLTDLLWLRGELTTYQPAVSVISVLTPSELGFAMVLLPALLPSPFSSAAEQAADARKSQLLFFALAATALPIALMRGMLMPLVKPFLIYLVGFLFVRRRVLLWPVLLGLGAILILQPVKGEFRARVWDRQVESGLLDRAGLFLELTARHWLGSDVDRDTDKEQSLRTAAARTAGALALANAVELTPSTVPHQWGATYRYLRYAPVPRVFFPEKPIAQYADVWAAVMYGYTTERGTQHVMIGLSQIAEAYINFGFPLCLFMLMFIGVLLRIMDEVFSHSQAQNGALAIYLFFLQAVIFTSEGSLANFWGGVLQQFTLYAVAMALLGALFVRRGGRSVGAILPHPGSAARGAV